ncbi:hypothetical protein OUZ56_024063 [Daphnia magna]|uniref:Uncharacterized protein n=1 Tax=Daphnia magna TaxID=35525 RepID=A0ABR0B013_9CRUS|nr:hypothetical protein OUZ56_024063 [Daphnia magna]
MRQHLPQFPLGETTRNLLVSRQTQNGVSQSHDGDDDQKMDRISTDKCNAASTTATCPEGSETESMCDSADSYDILSPNGSDDDGVPVSDSDEESYQDCLDEDVNDADDSQSPTRKSQLLEILQYFELDKHDILKPGDTRWLSLKEYLDGIIEQWPSLLLHFEASLFDKQCEKSHRSIPLDNEECGTLTPSCVGFRGVFSTGLS